MAELAFPIGAGQAASTAREDVAIGPPLAHEFLKLNRSNRPISARRVRRYAEMMRRGEWPYAGDPIRFDLEGWLIDGQHRLLAVIESGALIVFSVLRGLPPEARDVIDQGAKRTGGDVLTIHGVDNGKRLSAALKWVYRDAYDLEMASGGEAHPSMRQLVALHETHPGLTEHMHVESWLRRAPFRRYPPSLAAELHYEMATRVEPFAADLFWQRVVDGAQLEATDPILLLRNLLIRDSAAQGAGKGFTDWAKRAYTIKAWKHWRAGRRLRSLLWRPRVEPYPKVEPTD